MGYQIGIDGGGTRSRIAVFKKTEERFRMETGGINYNSFSETDIRAHFAGMAEALRKNGYLQEACEGIGIGAAGISNPAAVPFLKAALREAGYSCRIVIGGDQEAALLGGIGNRAGILLIAGTGSICTAKNAEGKLFRAGGFGHVIDDGGSAYSVGRRILRAVVLAEDGRAVPTRLRQAVFSALGAERIEDLIAFLYRSSTTKRDIAAVASCLTGELIHTDQAAGQIARSEAAELVSLVKTVLAKMGDTECREPLPLLLEGGLIQKNPVYRQCFLDQLKSDQVPAEVTGREHDPAYGAVALLRQRT